MTPQDRTTLEQQLARLEARRNANRGNIAIVTTIQEQINELRRQLDARPAA